MVIADKLSQSNYPEYILYMWQVEDIIRAAGCDIENLASYLSRFDLNDESRERMRKWYADLSTMMREEGKLQSGHLQINMAALAKLEDVHTRLLASTKFPYYREMYYKVLPYIVELRAKGEDHSKSELHICFDLLYGLLMLRLQHKEISTETQQAAKDTTSLLATLSDYYFKDKLGELEL